MKKITIIIMSIIGIIIFFLLVIFIKKMIITQSKGFFITIFTLLFLIGMVFLIYRLTNQREEKIDTSKKMKNHFDRINDLLKMYANHDVFRWDFGNTTRMQKTSYEDKKEYIGIIGNSIKTGKRMRAIYCIQEDDLVDFTGDPDRRHEYNLFFGYKPKQHDKQTIIRDIYSNLARSRRRPSQRIIIGGKNDDRPVEVDDGQRPSELGG